MRTRLLAMLVAAVSLVTTPAPVAAQQQEGQPAANTPTQTEVIIKKLDGVTLHVAPKKSSTTSI